MLSIPTYVFVALGNILLLIVFLRALSRQRVEHVSAIGKVKEQATNDFYSINTNARIERAHHVFYKLHNQGTLLKRATMEQRRDWDREVQKSLRQHCELGAVGIYLSNTGRVEPGAEMNPLPDDKHDDALKFVRDLLDRDFDPFIRI